MEITVLEKIEQPDMHRMSCTVRCVYDGKATPSRMSLKEDIAKQLKAKPELVAVRRIKTAFGSSGADITVVVYKDEASLRQFEHEYVLKRGLPKAEEE
jgi:ribosomal protein S24E